MNSSPQPTSPDETDRAQQTINLGLALDTEARSETLARLIAACLHDGPGTALEHFATGGDLDAEQALQELNDARVPGHQEPWVDALGSYILQNAGEKI